MKSYLSLWEEQERIELDLNDEVKKIKKALKKELKRFFDLFVRPSKYNQLTLAVKTILRTKR